jgi:hypothetical protein
MTSLAFEIGFDHFRFNLPLDIARFNDMHRQQIRYGYEAAKMQKVTKKHPDRYEKKLLMIRDRALMKGLEVSITVTDLQIRLLETKGLCPITQQPLTYAENNESDWSVDRIDNDCGYTKENIVIISTIANQAKTDMNLSSIIKKALGKIQSDGLLTASEWHRMARFYCQKMKMQKPLCISLLLSECQPLYDQIVFLQLYKCQNKHSKAFLNKLGKFLGKDLVAKAAKLTSKRVYHRADVDVEVLYDSPKLYKWVQTFVCAINAHRAEFDGLLMDCMFA